MKKLLSLLLVMVMCFTLCLFGCGKDDENENSTTKKGTTGPGATASVGLQVDIDDGKNFVQIPVFQSDSQSDAIDGLNSDIQFLVDFYNKADSNVLKWADIRTHSFTTDKYLQAVVEYAEMPSMQLDKNVVSYAYDREKNKAISIADALDMAGYSDVQFDKFLNKMFLKINSSESLKNYEISGFYINEKDNVEFFVRLDVVKQNKDEYSVMATVIPDTNTLVNADKDGLKIV